MSDDPRIDGYATGLFEIARAEGTLDEVEDELFRFARSYESSDELRNALTDEQIPAGQAPGDRRGPARRQGHADHRAARVDGRRRRPRPRPAGDRRPPRAAGGQRRRTSRSPRCARAVAAHRRPAGPPQGRPRQRHRQATSTSRSIVDPSVLGGIVATVGDTVIDGTVRTRLDQLEVPSLTGREGPSPWLNSPSPPPTSPRRSRRTSRASSRRSRPAPSAASPRSATASPASPGLPDAAVNELLEFEDGTVGLALNLDEDSIGAVVLGDVDEHRGGPDGQGDRPHPLGARRRRRARPRRQRPRRADRRQGRARRRRSRGAWRSRRPASWAASRCTSRCRPASRRSTR